LFNELSLLAFVEPLLKRCLCLLIEQLKSTLKWMCN